MPARIVPQDELVVSGADIELTGQSAALIHQPQPWKRQVEKLSGFRV